jgi:WD40 repeat protein
VTFVGNRGEYVASGSDKGYFFLWDKASTVPVFIGHGDQDVVNVVQCHPWLPVLATSGIDHDIKVWEPLLDKNAARGVPSYVYALSREEFEGLQERLKRREQGITFVFGPHSFPEGCTVQ